MSLTVVPSAAGPAVTLSRRGAKARSGQPQGPFEASFSSFRAVKQSPRSQKPDLVNRTAVLRHFRRRIRGQWRVLCQKMPIRTTVSAKSGGNPPLCRAPMPLSARKARYGRPYRGNPPRLPRPVPNRAAFEGLCQWGRLRGGRRGHQGRVDGAAREGAVGGSGNMSRSSRGEGTCRGGRSATYAPKAPFVGSCAGAEGPSVRARPSGAKKVCSDQSRLQRTRWLAGNLLLLMRRGFPM